MSDEKLEPKDTDELDEFIEEQNTATDDAIELYKIVPAHNSIQDINKEFNDATKQYGTAEITRRIKIVGDYIEVLRRMLDSITEQTVTQIGGFESITDNTKVGNEFSHTHVDGDDEIESFEIRDRVLTSKGGGGREITGREASMRILANGRNIKKVYLYNSGFHIVIKAPVLSEINLIYNRLAEKMGEYGRMMGAVFYMYSDFKIKEVLWDFIADHIVDSNLSKFDNARLKNNISLLDYQPILLALGTLMFKNGFDFTTACVSCKNVESIKQDLSLLQLTDFSRIPLDVLSKMSLSTSITVKDTDNHRVAFRRNEPIIAHNYKVYLKSPTVGEYLFYGKQFNNELSVATKDLSDASVVDQYLRFSYCRANTPWIMKIESIGDDGECLFTVSDPDSIGLIMNEIQMSPDSNAFTEQLEKYIQTASVTHIGYPVVPCSKCGAIPSGGSTTGFIPFDAQESFFTMLVMRLIQA